MTRLCVVATGGTPEAMLSAAARAASAGADMAELRLDHLKRPEEMAPRVLEGLEGGTLQGLEVAASLRAPRDGGRYVGGEEGRRALLETVAASAAGLAWLDLEGDLPVLLMERLASRAREAGARVLVSWHVGDEIDWDGIAARARSAVKEGLADAVKVVVPTEDRSGLDAVLGFSWSLDREEVPHVLLPSGRMTRVGRLLAPVTSTLWVYSELADTGYRGPLGLPRFDELDAGWRRMGLRHDAHQAPWPAPPLRSSDVSGEWTLLALLGDPVAHTNSPVLHHAAMRSLGMRGAYVPFRTSPGDVAKALEELELAGALGCNVTVPLKVEAARSVDELGQGARASGAVNTVVFEDGGRTRGENTDADGVAMTATELLGASGRGMTALVLGTGGAARGAAVGLAGWGARVLATGRSPDRLAGMVSDLAGAVEPVNMALLDRLAGQLDLLVQCTPQGMHGVPPEGPLMPVRVLDRVGARAVLDMVYATGGTDLVKAARLLGMPAAGGDRVLLHQAVVGFQLWTGRRPPVPEMERALRTALGG